MGGHSSEFPHFAKPGTLAVIVSKPIAQQLKTVFPKVTIEKLQLDSEAISLNRDSDLLSYPEFLRYFQTIDQITQHNLIIGINFTYGWMPTIFEFQSKRFDEVLAILNRAKRHEKLSTEDLAILKCCINNSLVGTSKLLHFINPEQFAIWDSRVYRYLTSKEPYKSSIGNCDTYLKYLELCHQLATHNSFDKIKQNIESKVGYQITDMRAIELIMYTNGKKKKV